MRMRRAAGTVGVALVLACTACGAADPVVAAGPSDGARATADARPPSEVASAPVAPQATVKEPLDDAVLPGTGVRLHNPTAALAVVGAPDTGIAVHAAPRGGAAVVATAWAGSTRITATGRARRVDDALWVEVTIAPQEALGWARSADLVRASVMEDVTDAVRTRFAGDLPEAAGIAALGAMVADTEAAFYDGATVARARPGLVDGVGDVSYDIALPADDAISAIRLRIIGAAAGPRADRFRLVAVERSLLCRPDAVRPGTGCDLRCLMAPAQPEWKVPEGTPPTAR